MNRDIEAIILCGAVVFFAATLTVVTYLYDLWLWTLGGFASVFFVVAIGELIDRRKRKKTT